MPHKFQIGEVVEYQPTKSTILRFKVVRLMPVEFPSSDWKYRIKSEAENCERIVGESDLRPPAADDFSASGQKAPRRSRGRHH